MTATGIQIKPDHPALSPRDPWGNQLPRPDSKVIPLLVVPLFARAYGFSEEHGKDMYNKGLVVVRETDDGSVWVEFRSDLTPEEASAALRAMGRVGL